MIRTKKFTTRPRTIEAVKVTRENMTEVARWCGGEVSFSTNEDYAVQVPTLNGNLIAEVGEWLVRDESTGKFSVYSEESFKAEGFHEVGLRQDGPHIRRGGDIRTPGIDVDKLTPYNNSGTEIVVDLD